MLKAYASTNAVSERIVTLTLPEKKAVEKELEKEMTDLKKAQDALMKALERRKTTLLAIEQDEKEKAIAIAPPPVQLSDEEMENLVETIKNNYQHDTKQ